MPVMMLKDDDDTPKRNLAAVTKTRTELQKLDSAAAQSAPKNGSTNSKVN